MLAGRARAELAMRQTDNLSCGEGAIFYDAMPKLDVRGRFIAGTGLSLYSSPVQSQLTVEEGAEIRIGDGVMLNFGANVYASRAIEIGDATMVGTMVSIMDTNFHPVGEDEATRKAPVKIGRNV